MTNFWGGSFTGGSDGRQQHATAAGVGGGAWAAGVPPPQSAPRGPLPMTLDAKSKAHLATFLQTVGSFVLLPGNDAIRRAVFGGDGDGCGSEEMPDATAAPSASTAGGVGGGRNKTENGSKAGGGAGVFQDGRPGAGDDGEGDESVVDAFAEACRAEAWAAAAVGALFSGAGEEEGKEYVSRALRSISRCLDAPLPEVRVRVCVCADG